MWHKAIVGALSLCVALSLTGCRNVVVSEGEEKMQVLTTAEGKAPMNDLRIDWVQATAAPAVREIYCDQGIVYVEFAYGMMLAISQQDGALKWLYPLPGALDYAPCSTENKVFIFIDGTMHILDKATGKRLAMRNPHVGSIAPPAAASKVVIVANAQGQIVGLSAINCAPAWVRGTDTLIIASAFVAPDQYYCLTIDGQIRQYDTSNGEVKWMQAVPGRTPVAPPLAVADGLFVGGRDNTVYAYGPDGGLRWKRMVGGVTVNRPALAHGKLIVITDPDIAVVLDPATGDELWRQKGLARFLTATPERAYFLDANGATLLAFNLADGALLGKLDAHNFQRFCADPEAGRFMAVTADGRVYSIIDVAKAPPAAAPATTPATAGPVPGGQ